MSAGAALWLRLVTGAAATAVCLLALSPPRPAVRLPLPAACAAGAGCGLALFGVAARRRPRLLVAPARWPLFAARLAVLGLWAANEEVVWRRVALGELLPAGVVPALVLSTIGFALLHRARRRLHLGTGGAFAAVYLTTGLLAASIVAHWTYNVLVGALVDRSRA
ncbi:MAG TPA: CPBP family intramembrane glutamic endopeptidase [Gaiellaceae bacterium]|nr:CPBP family intramembrane glutamic endopeptidase [Gaiellaceae bacterium]